MFGASQGGVKAYVNVGEESGVMGASPHKLIVMLFDGALVAVASALQYMKSGNIPAKGQSISKAIMIIDGGLRASLNLEVGGAIAANLNALYMYMSNQLLIANLKNQPETLEMVRDLLQGLKESWEAIGDKPATSAVEVPDVPAVPKLPAYDALAPKTTSRFLKA
jgi:flagellar protein FliS